MDLENEREHLETFKQSYVDADKELKDKQKEIDLLQSHIQNLENVRQENKDLQDEIDKVRRELDENNLKFKDLEYDLNTARKDLERYEGEHQIDLSASDGSIE